MAATVITTTTTTITSSKATRNSRLKNFLNRHCYIVDFLSAAITIVLCLTILLPRVHHSFLPQTNNETQPALAANGDDDAEAENNPLPLNQTVEKSEAQHEDDHQHRHEHRFPIAELLICIGFFVFYCAGLSLGRPQVTGLDQELFMARRRRQSTTCCTTTRCPGPNNGRRLAAGNDERAAILSPTGELQAESDCLMLINPHHQHHTHAKYHGHSLNNSSAHSQRGSRQQRVSYGTTQTIITDPNETYNAILGEQDNIQVTPRPTSTIVVDEIRITSEPKRRKDQWPHSLGLLLFSVILGCVLVFFDMNVLGMIRAVKVFRATSTGALLYVAFFIMLPLKQNHCNSCEKEEEDTSR